MATAHSVAELLNAAQDSRSEAALARCAGQLWKLILQDPDKNFEQLLQCVEVLLAVSQKSPHVQSCINFFSSFGSKAPQASEAATAVAEGLLTHLARHSAAADKSVRFHACQLLHQLLGQLPASVLSDDAVLDSLTEALLERLQDKQPGIRAEAVRGLCDLAGFYEKQDTQDIVDAVTALLNGDKSKDVRMAVVLSLPLDTHTLPVLLQRTRDTAPTVRKALAVRLGGLSIKLLSIKQRASILQQLLQDRDASVADAGRAVLAQWLERDCGGDPLLLLQLLDVETYTDAAVCAVKSLITSNKLHAPGQQQQQRGSASEPSAIAYVHAATAAAGAGSGDGVVGLRALCRLQGRLLAPHEALLWRCLCEWLQTDAISRGLAAAATAGARAAVQAAVAAERHEALEALLPETADELMGLVLRHTAAGPPARFAAAQLLTMAAKCMEWTDVASRDSAAPLLQQLIALDPTTESDPDTHMDSSDDEAEGDSMGLQLAGNGGAGLFEAGVVQLVASLHGSAAGFTGAMLEGLGGLAAAAGLLRKPVADAGGEQHGAFTVGAAEPSQVLQLLCYARMMLQHMPIRSHQGMLDEAGAGNGSISFGSLWELLLLLALKQDNVLVRAQAVECIGLYAVVAAGSNPALLTAAVTLLGPLLASGGSEAVRGAAVRALADIALLYGPAAVDAVLRRPSNAAAAADRGVGSLMRQERVEEEAGGEEEEQGQGEGDDVRSSSSSRGACKGLLELLLQQGQGLLADTQAGGADRKGGRPSTKTKQAAGSDSPLSPAAADLMAVVAETLAKLLLHQRAWLRQYQPHQPKAHTDAAAAAGTGAHAADGSADKAHGDEARSSQGVGGVGGPVQLPPDSQQQQALLLQAALALLLQLQFHPATAGVTQVCQCLSVFFDVFCAACEANRLQLAAACLPAARQALHIKTKKHPAPLLVKYVLQLLQQARLRQEQLTADAAGSTPQQGAAVSLLGETFGSVAHLMLVEVHTVWPLTVGAGKQPAVYKPYLSSLLKIVVELPGTPGPQDLTVLQSMAHTLSVLTSSGSSSSTQDASFSKDVAALQQHLQALADASGAPQASLSGCDLQALVQQVSRLSLQQLPALPADIAAAAAAAAAAAGCDAHAAAAAAGATSAAGGSSRATRSSSRASGGSGAATAGRGRGRGRGRPSAAARKAAAAAAAASSSDDDDSSSSSSGDDQGDSDAEGSSGAATGVPAAAAARSQRRASAAAVAVAADSSDNSDAGSDGSGHAAHVTRRSSAAAAAGSGRAAAAAAAAAAVASLTDSESYDSEGFATADDDSGDEEGPLASPAGKSSSKPIGKAAKQSTAAAAGPGRRTRSSAGYGTRAGHVSEMSDSEDESSGDDDDESSGDEQQAPQAVQQQGGKGAGKQDAQAAAAAAGSRRPLGPSSAANRRVQ